jgi:hypothetical protein
MFSDENADKVLAALAMASPTRASVNRRQIVVNEVCANLGLSNRELKQALEDLERAGDIRRAHLDLGSVLVTHTGRIRSERLAQALERQGRNERLTDATDITTMLGGT